jgi:hypothetical protein
MLTAGSYVQLRYRGAGTSEARYAGVVVIQNGSGVMLELLDPLISLPIADCEIWCRKGTVQRRFIGRILDAMDVGPGRGPQVTVTIRGDSLQTERRAACRYMVDRDLVAATVGDRQEWRVVDLSAHGIGFLSIERLPIGSRIPISVSSKQDSATGDVVVRHFRKAAKGLVRFGVAVPPSEVSLRRLLGESTASLHGARLRALRRIRERVFTTG